MIDYLKTLVEDRDYAGALSLAEQLLVNRDNELVDLLEINEVILKSRYYMGEIHGAMVAGEITLKLARDLEEWDCYGSTCMYVGVIQQRMRNHQAAIESFYEYLAHLPKYCAALDRHVLAWYNLGLMYQATGKLEESTKALARALKVANDLGDGRKTHGVRHALIGAYMDVGNLNAVPPLLAKCLHFIRHNTHLDDIEVSRNWHWQLRAEYALRTNRLHRAAKIAERALRATRTEPLHQFYFCMILAKVAQRKEAAREAVGYSLAARVHAIHCRRYDLEYQAAEFMYQMSKSATPNDDFFVVFPSGRMELELSSAVRPE